MVCTNQKTIFLRDFLKSIKFIFILKSDNSSFHFEKPTLKFLKNLRQLGLIH